MREQKIEIMTYKANVAKDAGLADVRGLLGDGWRIVSVTPMGGGGEAFASSAVVVLERDAPAK
jgi:hypothetical protein